MTIAIEISSMIQGKFTPKDVAKKILILLMPTKGKQNNIKMFCTEHDCDYIEAICACCKQQNIFIEPIFVFDASFYGKQNLEILDELIKEHAISNEKNVIILSVDFIDGYMNFRINYKDYGYIGSWQQFTEGGFDIENVVNNIKNKTIYKNTTKGKKKVAFVSPLPPEKTGIAIYSVALIKQLSAKYEMYLINDNSKTQINADEKKDVFVHNVNWFRHNAAIFDAVIYQFGNSLFHAFMFDLVKEIPGIVVLHDLFMGDVQLARNQNDETLPIGNIIHSNYGYKGVIAFLEAQKNDNINSFLANHSFAQDVLQYATNIVTTSNFARKYLLENFSCTTDNVACIGLPRIIEKNTEKVKKEARKYLKQKEEGIITCSFGFVTKLKESKEILEAWLKSNLAKNSNNKLIFVGKVSEDSYGREFLKLVHKHPEQVVTTGFVTEEIYNKYLECADIAIQLRIESRGETMASVLDCMAHGIPTIANNHGTIREIEETVLRKIPEYFQNKQLLEAINETAEKTELQNVMSEKEVQYINSRNNPQQVGKDFSNIIELNMSKHNYILQKSQKIIRKNNVEKKYYSTIARIIAQNKRKQVTRQRLYLDITAIAVTDLQTGIQRVVRNVEKKIFGNEQTKFSIEPVYFFNDRYYYARNYFKQERKIDNLFFVDEPISFQKEDVFVGLDLVPYLATKDETVFKEMYYKGVAIYFVVYDLLPIELPEYFLPGMKEEHEKWLSFITKYSKGLLCISKSVAQQVENYIKVQKLSNLKGHIQIDCFNMGNNIDKQSSGITRKEKKVLKILENKKTFLMVGTIEPRKGYAATLKAFKKMWEQGLDIRLLFVGKNGWAGKEFADTIRCDNEYGRKLFWLENASDECLESAYKKASALISSSYGEGFGLPLIEAMKNGIPLILRDIPVFREVAGDEALYFNDDNDITSKIKIWLKKNEEHKKYNITLHTWKDSAQDILDIINDKREPLIQMELDKKE